MIDQSLGPLPQRADPHKSRALRGGRTWFSRETIEYSEHFEDVSWARLFVPVLLGAAGLTTGVLLGTGALAGVLKLVGTVALLASLPGLIARVSGIFTPHH